MPIRGPDPTPIDTLQAPSRIDCAAGFFDLPAARLPLPLSRPLAAPRKPRPAHYDPDIIAGMVGAGSLHALAGSEAWPMSMSTARLAYR